MGFILAACLWVGWFCLWATSLQLVLLPNWVAASLLAAGTFGLGASAHEHRNRSLLQLSACCWLLLAVPMLRPAISVDQGNVVSVIVLGAQFLAPVALLPFLGAFSLMMLGQSRELKLKGAEKRASECLAAPLNLVIVYYSFGLASIGFAPLTTLLMFLMIPILIGVATQGFFLAILPCHPRREPTA